MVNGFFIARMATKIKLGSKLRELNCESGLRTTQKTERIRKGPIKVKVVRSNEAGFLAALDEAKEKLLTLRKASNEKQMQLGERVLQDEILEQLEKLDVLEEQQESAKKNYAQSQADTQKIEAQVRSELKELKLEKVRVSNELAEACDWKRRRRFRRNRYFDLWQLQSAAQSAICQ